MLITAMFWLMTQFFLHKRFKYVDDHFSCSVMISHSIESPITTLSLVANLHSQTGSKLSRQEQLLILSVQEQFERKKYFRQQTTGISNVL